LTRSFSYPIIIELKLINNIEDYLFAFKLLPNLDISIEEGSYPINNTMDTNMTREEIQHEILKILSREFEIENPELDDDLREKYEFDSIDAIELLVEIEHFLKAELTQEEKKQAMDIRTINHICDYVEALAKARA
jgi:acyl carrier protein